MRTRTNTNRRGGLILAAVAAIALMGGSAFTASNTITSAPDHVGYGSVTVSGATVESLDYTLSSDGSVVNAVVLEIKEDFADGAEVKVTLDDQSPVPCTDAGDTATPFTWNCDTSALNYATSSLTETAVSVKAAATA